VRGCSAAALVSRVNRNGARRQAVQDAVSKLETLGTPDAVIAAAALERSRRGFKAREGHIAQLPAPTRLAVEMALHEEDERRALEGELWLLERRWKEAEEIAAISDDLLLPEGAAEFVEQHKEPPGPWPEGSRNPIRAPARMRGHCSGTASVSML
jgi:hypothetical protein